MYCHCVHYRRKQFLLSVSYKGNCLSGELKGVYTTVLCIMSTLIMCKTIL